MSCIFPKRKILILKIIFSVYIQTKPKLARMVTIFFRRGNLHQSPEKTSANPQRLKQLILSTASSRASSSSVWRTFCRQATDLALIPLPMRRRAASRTGTTRRTGASMRYCRRSTRSPTADRSGHDLINRLVKMSSVFVLVDEHETVTVRRLFPD